MNDSSGVTFEANSNRLQRSLVGCREIEEGGAGGVACMAKLSRIVYRVLTHQYPVSPAPVPTPACLWTAGS